ncbi:MAG: metalloregulator ArsR/SmtB family transcription factor [Nocardiopsaceae bacterium]|nr:metalloregulator ArsR/SmtB family transcription factor [Nocardiopsaceae bacterium]
MDEVFKALADGSRRRLLDSLNVRSGQSLQELCAGLEMTRQAVSKHLGVLEGANLVSTVWRGREKLHYLNAEPINAIADRWMSRYDRARAAALADLKTALEQESMESTEFVYTTYIKTTPQRLWQALTDPVFTRRYWGVALETDWQEGSTITWHEGEFTSSDSEQVVLEARPYRRLAYAWHTMTAEKAREAGLDEQDVRKAVAEPRSKVSFDIEPLDGQVKLTVIHGGFEPGSVILRTCRVGWPALLSSLKTLLETGDALPPAGGAAPAGQPAAAQ